ncbi:MAG: hypothetical protein K6G30_10570, partial [Acetatifactor sp.]|nr:hypothetical protein [Acetatifactor sp.]
KHMDILEIPYKAYANLPSLFEIYQKAADMSCKVMLTGQTGNTTVSYGYSEHIFFDLFYHHRYILFLRYLNHYCKHLRISRKQTLLNCIHLFQDEKKQQKLNNYDYVPDNPFLSETLKQYPTAKRMQQVGLPSGNSSLTLAKKYRRLLWLQAMFTYLGELDTKAGLQFGVLLRDPTRDMRILSFCRHLPYHLFAHNGTPRWLIRGNFRDILPTGLLDDWMRFGVQNSDYHQRFMRDWSRIYPTLSTHLLSPELSKYVCLDSVHSFCERSDTTLTNDQELETMYATFLEILYRFLIN